MFALSTRNDDISWLEENYSFMEKNSSTTTKISPLAS